MKRAVGAGFILSVFLLTQQAGLSAGPSSLYELFEGKTVKVYPAEVKDLTSDHKVDVLDVRSKLSEALKSRKSIRFEVVENKEAADILIEAELHSFYWTDHDPVDMLVGVGGTAMDAVIQEDYAKLAADFKVTDLGKNRLLWQDRVIATITKKPMSESESVPLVTEDLAKVFVRECFGKKRRR